MNANRERIRIFVGKQPDATVREIMAACGISSTSVVAHHLKAMRHDGKSDPELKNENDQLRAEVKRLQAKIDKIRKAAIP